jgi:hypothetical protein
MRSEYVRSLVLFSAVVVILNVVDLLSTYLASPDLSREWNVLHRRLNLGWSGLIGAKLIGGWLAVAGYGYYLRNRERCFPSPGLDGLQFSHCFLFGDDSAPQAGRTVGMSVRAFVTLGCLWAGMQIVLLWVAVDNLVLYHGIVLRTGLRQEWAYHIAQSMTVAVGVLLSMFRANYRRYRALAGASEPNPTRQAA